jgi:uncharacterized protein (TIGR03089 family)
VTTFTTILDRLLRTDPGRPLVTFYDHGTGERTELSVTTYANWVAKTASLLVDELDLERGQSLRVDLPAHWLGPVVMGAAWTVGLRVTWADGPDAVVCGPEGLPRWQDRASDLPVVASALHPLATRFTEPLPAGVVDLGVEVWSQPDAFVALDPPTGDDPATDDATQAQMWDAAAARSVLRDGDRVLSEVNPASPSGVPSFTEPLVRGGSLVLVTHSDPERLEATYAAERATARFPWS